MPDAPLILWFRRDLRLADHPMLQAALATGRPLVPVFILDPETEALGAAPKLRLGLAIAAFDKALQGLGARLVLRRGPALQVLAGLVAETGATGLMWSRMYDGVSRKRDSVVKDWARGAGLAVESHPGALLHEPWEVVTGQGGPYRVYSPFWRALSARAVLPAAPAPGHWPLPRAWPMSDTLADWQLDRAMNRGAAVLAAHQSPGEAAALARLDGFLADKLGDYAGRRDAMGADATSGLSEHLAWGEIGPRTIWHGAMRAGELGAKGAGKFLSELAWREFAWHLLYHYPEMDRKNWKPDWDGFPWAGDNEDAEAWRRGMTGEPLVDAAMREVFVTGRMHNRARMVVASFLTKHLLTHWRVGLDWFADVLTDWDPASNAMGWQWVAGSGPDAAPYFRIFNPATQAETHDPDGRYRRRWLTEGQRNPPATALDFFRAAPRSWSLSPDQPPPAPRIVLSEGRERALRALSQRNS